MNLYVIRHGETNLNKEERYNCRIDEDINEEGIKQAMEAGKHINELNIDLIICSPMKRTKHTMRIINKNNIEVIYDDRLMERIGGVLTGEKLGDFYYTDFWNFYSNKKVDGLESLDDLFKRVREFLDEIKEKYKNKNILLVTHGGVARAVYFYFNALPKDGMIEKVGINNCEIGSYKM